MFIGTTDMSLNREFLKQIDNFTQREVFAKIIALNWDEQALSEITGNIVSGNISVDGKAPTRRTCSLTIATDNINFQLNQLDWNLHTKFAVLIGLRNYVDKIHNDIIWFQQGIFIITSFSQQYNNNGLTVSIQGKDKMCLLDGTIGGSMIADNDFGKLSVIDDDGNESYEYIEIKNIIRDSVHKYGLEPYENIVLTDIEDIAVELLDYKVANQGLFLFDISASKDFSTYVSQMTFENQSQGILFSSKAPKKQNGKDHNGDPIYVYLTYEPFQIGDGLWYRIIKFVQYGETAGYRQTTLTYPGDLIVNAGSPLTQALDAVKNMLGEFEYFYDIYGRFIFQRKRIYHNIAWHGAITNEGDSTYYDSLTSTQSSYAFKNGFLINSYNNKPNLTNIKNDFSIWGTSQSNAPIHLRYALDDKPLEYTSLLDGIRYYTNESVAQKTEMLVYFDEQKNFIDLSKLGINKDLFLQKIQEVYSNTQMSDLQKDYTFHYRKIRNVNYWFLDNNENYPIEEFGVSLPYSYQTSLSGENIIITFKIKGPVAGRTDQLVDWRELIYQMACDNARSEAYIYQLTLAMSSTNWSHYKSGYPQISSLPDLTNVFFYDTATKKWKAVSEYGQTNYDKLSELQHKKILLFGDPEKGLITTKEDGSQEILSIKNWFTTKTYVEEIAEWSNTWNTGYDAYYPDMLAFWRGIYDLTSPGSTPAPTQEPGMSVEDYAVVLERYEKEQAFLQRQKENQHWNPDIINYYNDTIHFIDPGLLIFWIDFFGQGTELEKYKVKAIGRRSKAVKDNDVKSIFVRATPEILFIDPRNTEPPQENISYARLNLSGGLSNYFHNSSQGKTAKDVLDNLLYTHTFYQESITLNSLPVYYLEPNTRITIYDEATGIFGDYLIQSFNFTFQHDGMMNINANRAIERIL